ncbi:MAG: hypothetical protein ACJ76Z_00695 [Thermoleophilaceae bacterium]
MNELPSIDDVVVQTTAVLINLAAKALADDKPDDAKRGIEAARALLPQCPEDVQRQLRDPLAHLQMEFVKASQQAKKPADADADADAEQRAKARSKLWTPPGT